MTPIILTPDTRARILLAFYRDGQNTAEIARLLDLLEAEVAEALRADREERAWANAGRRR